MIDVKNIVCELNELGYSDRRIGDWVGVNLLSIFNYRNGKQTPSLKVATRIYKLNVAVKNFHAELEKIQD